MALINPALRLLGRNGSSRSYASLYGETAAGAMDVLVHTVYSTVNPLESCP